MIPEYLLNLVCTEFPTYESAMKSSPYGTDRIVYEQPIDADILSMLSVNDIPIDQMIRVQHREIILRRLPSGFWAFLPTHPDDLSIVSEHKKKNIQFGQTQIICSNGVSVPESRLKQDESNLLLDRLKIDAKRQVMDAFVHKVSQDKIYRIAFIDDRRDCIEFGRIVTHISVSILYAEESYSDVSQMGKQHE